MKGGYYFDRLPVASLYSRYSSSGNDITFIWDITPKYQHWYIATKLHSFMYEAGLSIKTSDLYSRGSRI
jgi:hypothetical protein